MKMKQTMVLGIGNAGGSIVAAILRKTKDLNLKEALYFLADCNESDLTSHHTNPS